MYERVSDYLDPVPTAEVVLITGWHFCRVATFWTGGR